ncbi:hypothetical protein EJ06DRAFT_583847 [Trichodelitschia bisporula]|uniref:Uncharacterized protein n=1 Tax=Trichodelitschia bisporula TaxID=703511 RepID=A0A6G1HPQ9_9PEZI|nr:hypothetical protein EJ06DRAFT_583847 [Trichodelitschia bisporula]
MASLLKAIPWFGPKEQKVVMFGLGASGKATLLHKWKLGADVSTASTTVGFCNVETIAHRGTNYEIWAVRGCDGVPAYISYFVSPNCLGIFVHGCGRSKALSESFAVLHEFARQLQLVGARYLWIVFNKQDLLPPESASTTVAETVKRFEEELARYEGRLSWEIVATPGFSAKTGAHIYDVLDSISHTEVARDAPPLPLHQELPAQETSSYHPRVQETELDLEPAAFWHGFLAADLPVWNHRNYLRAGYMILLDCIGNEKGIFDSAETFTHHLERLREAWPNRFHDAENRTLTIFWLYILRFSINRYKRQHNLPSAPPPSSFNLILLHSPALTNPTLWQAYYTATTLSSPPAHLHWTTPDLAPLPTLHHPSPLPQDTYRLLRFALSVAQYTLHSLHLRHLIQTHALSALQSNTMRARAHAPSSLPPYSATQATFWIQIVHVALSSLSLSHPTLAPTLSLQTFTSLFPLPSTLWMKHYTPRTWNSYGARTHVARPDRARLPSLIPPQNLDVLGDHTGLLWTGEIPPLEELSFHAALLTDEICPGGELRAVDIGCVSSHAEMLAAVWAALQGGNAESLAARGRETVRRLRGPYVRGVTWRRFWAGQVLSNVQGAVGGGFEGWVRGNGHVVYEELWRAYYTPVLWESEEAREKYVRPDLKGLEGMDVGDWEGGGKEEGKEEGKEGRKEGENEWRGDDRGGEDGKGQGEKDDEDEGEEKWVVL